MGTSESLAEGAEDQDSAESRTRQLILLEPPRPISQFLYKCDSLFHTELLDNILRECGSSSSVAFVVIDGNGALVATLRGSQQKILWKISVDLPKKHRKGGQSSVRFSRLRTEARHNYLTKVRDVVTKLLTAHTEDNTSTGKLICDAIVIAGNADFKDGLNKLLEPPVKNHVVGVVDVQYGGQQGLYQAIQLSSSLLENQEFIKQRLKFSDFFTKIAMDSGKVCYGIEDTLYALESGAVDQLLVWENLKTVRFIVRATQDNSEEKVTVFCSPEENPLEKVMMKHKKLANAKLAIESAVPVLDWILAKHKDFGAHVELVSDETPEGSQFCKGFGGLGAILRYQSNLPSQEDEEDDCFEGTNTPFDLQSEIDAYLDGSEEF
mmetsp:Transcript_17957/g.25046  ORF Transcript_17957/g.25046 Transcript_17957/m.25046 type:complete len:379 (-) Transcript_17957:654-1790(-)